MGEGKGGGGVTMYISALTMIAVVIGGLVVLIVLGKISRQLDKITTTLTAMEKKLTAFHSTEDSKIIQAQGQLHELTKEIKTMKHDVDWKG